MGDDYMNEFNILLNYYYYLFSYFDVSFFIKSDYNDNLYGKNNLYNNFVFVINWLDFIYQINKNVLILKFTAKIDNIITGTTVVVYEFVTNAENWSEFCTLKINDKITPWTKIIEIKLKDCRKV